jgi:hypothetical protein
MQKIFGGPAEGGALEPRVALRQFLEKLHSGRGTGLQPDLQPVLDRLKAYPTDQSPVIGAGAGVARWRVSQARVLSISE